MATPNNRRTGALCGALCALLCAAAGAASDAERVERVLAQTPLIDGHNDLPWEMRSRKASPMDVDAVDLTQPTGGDTDIPKLRLGEVGAQFWSVYVPGEQRDGHFARVQLEQIDLARRIIAKYPNDLALCLSTDDIVRAHAAGKIGSLIGIEGGHAIENSLGVLRAYYDLGARYMTLTHNVTLAWADAASDEPHSNGLSAFGREVVREMNRLGMMVDLAHVAPPVMRDALDVSEAPVIFSHSCARALADHARNVPDDVLKRLPGNGGVVMVTFVPLFVARSVAAWWAPVWPEVLANPTRSNLLRVKEERTKVAGPEPRATLADVADQIDYVRKVAGVDHVGIGGDFPATAGAPDGLENVSKYPELFAELIRRGWTDDALVKLAGGNLLRVMRTAEDAARKLRTERPASIATLESKADEVLKLEDLWATARVKRDVKTLDGLLAPDFVSTENNRTMDRATTVRELTSGAETIEAAGNEEMTLHDFGAMAAVTGWLAVRGHGSSGSFARRYRYTDSWVRTPSGWRLAIAHYDLVPEGR